MEQAFINHPHLATDALVLGKSFKDIEVQQNKVYDWTQSR